MPYQKSYFSSFCTAIALVVTAVFLYGCSDDENLFPSDVSTVPEESFLSSFYQSDELVYAFEYNGEKRLSRQILRLPEDNFVSEFEYNELGKMSKMIGVQNGRVLELDIFYNDDQMIDSVYSLSDGTPWVINKFLYNSSGTLSRMIEFAPGTRSVVYNDYYWKRGNIIRRETYFPQADERLEDRWVVAYEYDTLTNPFTVVYKDVGFHLIDREPISEHNWTSLRIYNKATGNIFREIDKEYQYLGNGFPYRNRTFVYDGGDRSEDKEGVIADFFY